MMDTEEERRLIGALKNLDNLLSPELWKAATAKSAAESAKARAQGNQLYARPGHDVKAHVNILRLYTRSAAFAPPDSEELALAYGNRSAALVHLGKYVECLEDLDRALDLPLSDIHVAKYLCRKVECQTELGMKDARITCEEAKIVLQEMQASDAVKKSIVIRLVNAIVKLEKTGIRALENKRKIKLPDSEKFENHRSAECPESSNALLISRASKSPRFGRHLTATRDIYPGEVLYVGKPYVSLPMENRVHSNCSHCLRFAWAGVPCDDCVYAVYCSQECKDNARRLYHDVECRIVDRAWKVDERMNTGRLMSLRMLIIALKETDGLMKLRESIKAIDSCTDYRKKGFSNNHTVFTNNYKSAYSLVTLMRKKSIEELEAVSNDSAVLLHLLAKHTKLFRRHFDYEKKALARSDDALFVGKLLSHYQHLILINAVAVKDTYTATSTDWCWVAPREENCTGLYLTPFLSLLNHSCNPNVARCEMKDGNTVLYSILPITKGCQVFDCYGPMYTEVPVKKRQELIINRFHFVCDCTACKNKWPMFMIMINDALSYSTLKFDEVQATMMAHEKCEKILESMTGGKFDLNPAALQDLAYAIFLTIMYCKSPNWRLPSLTATLIAVFNELYGYLVNVPAKC